MSYLLQVYEISDLFKGFSEISKDWFTTRMQRFLFEKKTVFFGQWKSRLLGKSPDLNVHYHPDMDFNFYVEWNCLEVSLRGRIVLSVSWLSWEGEMRWCLLYIAQDAVNLWNDLIEIVDLLEYLYVCAWVAVLGVGWWMWDASNGRIWTHFNLIVSIRRLF